MTQNIFFCLFLITFNAQLVNVFGISFPCASHHPAALCMFRSYLLLSVIAVTICNCLHMLTIIKVALGNVNVKFAFPLDHYNSMINVPATIRHKPTTAFFVRCSLNTIKENAIDTKILSLSIGTTTLAIPSCNAL